MGTCDCAVVQERVIVPEAFAVKESVVVPEIPRINNSVVVPVITAYRARPPYRVDPKWPDLELTPRFHVWLIAYTTGEDPDYDLTFWIYDQVIEVDWGDGTTEILNGREEPGYHTCRHKFKEGTGTLDSHGERFWHVDLYVKEDHAVYNAIELSPVYNNVKSNSKVKAVSINKNGLYSYLILNWAQNTAVNWIEYVRVIGKHILKADTLRSVYLHEIRYDSEDIAFDKLPGNTVSKLLGQYPFDVFNYKNIKAYWGAVFSFMYAPNLLNYRYDLSRFNFLEISNLFEQNIVVTEIILPTDSERAWTNMGYTFSGCNALRKIVFPENRELFDSVNELGSAFSGCINLQEAVNFPTTIGRKATRLNANGFNNCPKLSISFGTPETKLNVFNSSVSAIYGLQFSKDSPFGLQSGGAHININGSKFEYGAIMEVFEQLPDFSGQSQRIINITDNPGTHELTEGDIKIATDKNWQVIGV